MPAYPRCCIVDPEKIEIFHIYSRCVQRAWLCGFDPLTQVDFSYRREWIKKLIEYQAGIFALDVGNYNILSNHLHLIVRTRPDIVKGWSDEEVAWRWKRAWPKWDDQQGVWDCIPSDQSIGVLLSDPIKISQIRKGLSSLSWFAARIKEPIARLANAEMERRGHFWEQRFFSRKLTTEGAVLMCSIYVDLNQVKAGLATGAEDSHYSAIQERLRLWKKGEAEASLQEFLDQNDRPDIEITLPQMEELYDGLWLSPISEKNVLLAMPPEFYSKQAARVVVLQGASPNANTAILTNVSNAAAPVISLSDTHCSANPSACVVDDVRPNSWPHESTHADEAHNSIGPVCDESSIAPEADTGSRTHPNSGSQHNKRDPSTSDDSVSSVVLSQPCPSGHDSHASPVRCVEPALSQVSSPAQGSSHSNRSDEGAFSHPKSSERVHGSAKAENSGGAVTPKDNNAAVSVDSSHAESPSQSIRQPVPLSNEAPTKSPRVTTRRDKVTYEIDGRLRPYARRRASDDAFLPLRIDAYLALVGWSLLAYRASQAAQNDAQTAKSRSQDPSGTANVLDRHTVEPGNSDDTATSGQQLRMPETLQQVLVRFDIFPDRWATAVGRFERIFGRAVGNAHAIAGILAMLGQKWLRGLKECRQVFFDANNQQHGDDAGTADGTTNSSKTTTDTS